MDGDKAMKAIISSSMDRVFFSDRLADDCMMTVSSCNLELSLFHGMIPA